VPIGFVVLLLDQRASPLPCLEVGAKDLGARCTQLLADQGLHGISLVAAALLVVVWRVGHHASTYRRCAQRNRRGPRASATDVSRSR
jgi:hypothetical protein